MPEDNVLPPVLAASVSDVRHFVSLLRGVNIVNRANVSAAEDGLVITVEEARTLLATAYIFPHVFDEFAYHPEPPPQALDKREQPTRGSKLHKGKGKRREKLPSSQEGESETESETESDSEDDKMKDGDWRHSQDPSQRRKPPQEDDLDEDGNLKRAEFEIPLNTLIECLNVFGTASTSNTSSGTSSTKAKKGGTWNRANENEGSDDEGGERRRGALDNYFAAAAGQEKRTGMRMSYHGSGYPLTLIIAEDASGPTTTCEITTFEPESQLELDFDSSRVVLKIILKSSWLRDALSELDPSCEKLTFIGNSPTTQDDDEPLVGDGHRRPRPKKAPPKPMFRIQAAGTLGSTEMDYPNDREVLETFECKDNVRFSYRFAHVARMLRALQSSAKTSLRIDEDGLLSVQFLMPLPKTRAGNTAQSFLEFRCLALEEDL
ncbi:Rad1/Rec1/Rad17 [Crepidotus variabilis]|uniref:Rad1/Rec1/Rad17 n=1 Tax=Crepidotus variabilis TaxID=179855 RepID=A0A9P6ER23_9AGAR|nr:Rad1/Rec1/Rad17 [Crepidotus variabilis]